MELSNSLDICEICKECEYDYIGHLVLDSADIDNPHFLCHNCIAIGLVDIYSHFKVQLKYFALPIVFMQTVERDGEDGIIKPHLVPVQRKGDMF